jgi:hypothetical protein
MPSAAAAAAVAPAHTKQRRVMSLSAERCAKQQISIKGSASLLLLVSGSYISASAVMTWMTALSVFMKGRSH